MSSEEKQPHKTSLEDIKRDYLIAGQTIGFSEGRRRFIRYCLETEYIFFTLINENGPEPFDYLNYAKQDILTSDIHGAINSIENAKKAVHLVVDTLFNVWGLDKAYKKANFPIKLDILRNLEAFPINFLNNLNQERNLIEHEYKSIDPNKASNLIETAEMFLMLAYPYLKHISVSALVGLEKLLALRGPHKMIFPASRGDPRASVAP